MINIFENSNIIIGVAIALVAYVLIKSTSKKDKKFEKEYHEIINSDKYKTKGQYD